MIKDIKNELLREYSIKLNTKISKANANTKKILKEHPALERLEKRIASCACDNMLSMLENEETLLSSETIDKLIEERNEYLRSNNIPINYNKPKYDCNLCQDTAYYKEDYCICFKQQLSKKLFYMHQTMDTPNVHLLNYSTDFFTDKQHRIEMDKILNTTNRYVEDLLEGTDKNLIFFGNNGLGKTYLLSALANSLMDLGKTIVYQSAPVLLEKIKRLSFTNDSESLNELIENCDLLIIDDLGKDYITDYTKSTLFNIINIRYNRKKPIAISTNLDLREGEIEGAYGSAIQSRLVEKSVILLFEGTNVRTQKKNG